MNKKLTLTGTNVFFLVFSVVFVVYQLIMGVILGEKVYDHLYTIILINEFVMIMGFVVVYSIIKKVNVKETFRLNKPAFLPMVLITVISVPAYFVASALNNTVIYLLQFVGDIPTDSFPVPQNIPELIVGILIVGLAPGICEEIMHRGLFLKAYEKRGSYKAVVIVAIYFGIFHFDITNLLGPVFLGLIIGYYVIRTNSIFAGILAHFLNNTIATLLLYTWRNQPAQKVAAISSEELLAVLVVGALCMVITGLLMLVFKRVTEGQSEIVPPISRVGQDVKAILTHWPIILILIIYIFMSLLFIFSIAVMKLLG